MARAKHYVICLSNAGYPASLEPRKVYSTLNDEQAARHGMVRVVDESGEDYLFPSANFAPIVLPRKIELALNRKQPRTHERSARSRAHA
jgi:hypothetical protein